MDSIVVQVRMPHKIVEVIDTLVQQGYFKNRSEALIDAARHLVLAMTPSGEIGSFVQDGLRKRGVPQKVDTEELDRLWKKVLSDSEWQERYGKTPDDMVAVLRGRK